MNRSLLFLITGLGLGLFAHDPINAQQADLSAVSWLSGCWVASSGDNRTDEVWMAPRGGLMVGMSRSVRGGRATGHEFILLAHKDGVLTYTPHPSGQATTDFAATLLSQDKLRFENPQHDFPQAIEYVRAGADSLYARVYAETDAAEPAFIVAFGRMPC